MYPHGEIYARARSHAQALVATSTYVLHVPRLIRTKTTIYKYTHVAIYRSGSDMDGAPGAEHMQCAAVAATRAHHRMRTCSRSISTHTDTRIRKPDRFNYIHIYIQRCIHIESHVYRMSPPRKPCLQPWRRASECLHVRARGRVGGAAAHNRPRRIEARPSASGDACDGAPPGRKRRIPRKAR
jgi:hypothetical protein